MKRCTANNCNSWGEYDGECWKHSTTKTFPNIETFICQLIDNCEGETVTEEFLQREYAAFLKLHN